MTLAGNVAVVTGASRGLGLMQRTARGLGELHIVVNNAGVAKVAPLAEMTPEDWRFTSGRATESR